MSTVWLLGTVKEKEQAALIKRKKAELLRNDLKAIIQDLVKRFPVQGKETSLSLRMSATLAYGVCVNLRVQAEDMNDRVLKLLTLKPVSKDRGIDLPTVPGANLMALPLPDDHDVGVLNSEEFHELEINADLLARAANRDITLQEFPNDGALDYQGVPLPVLTEAEAQEQMAIFDNDNVGIVEGANKRKAEEEGGESVAAKKQRTEELDVGQVEVTLVEAETPGGVGAPSRPLNLNVPDITVTTVDSEGQGQGGGLPNRVDVAIAQENWQEVPEQVEQTIPVLDQPEAIQAEDVNAVANLNVVNAEDLQLADVHAGVCVGNDGQIEEPFLQPLVPAAGPVNGRGGRRRLPNIVVDARIALSAREIKASMEEGWKHTLRCDSSVHDLVDIETMEPFRREGFGRRLGTTLAQFAKDVHREEIVERNIVWEWDVNYAAEQQIEQPDVLQPTPTEQPIEQELLEIPLQPILPYPEINDGDMTRNSIGRRPEMEVSGVGNAVGDVAPEVALKGSVQPEAGLQPRENPEVPVTPHKAGLVPTEEPHVPLTPEKVLAQAEHAPNLRVDSINEPEQTEFNFEEDPNDVELRAETFKKSVEAKVLEACDTEGRMCIFQKLFSPENTTRLEVSVAFHELLKMEKEGKVEMMQEAHFGDIVIRLL